MPSRKSSKLWPLSVLTIAVSNALIAEVITIEEGDYYLPSASSSAVATLRSRSVVYRGQTYLLQFNGTVNLEGRLIVDKGDLSHGIFFNDNSDPDIDLNIKHSGAILVQQGGGSAIKFGRSAYSNINNSGYLYSRNTEVIAISKNGNENIQVTGTITNEPSGVIEGYAAMRIFEADLNGSFINNGKINTTGTAGVSIQTGGLYGNIVNNGEWTSNGYVFRVDDAGIFGGSIINSGNMTGTDGVIKVYGDASASSFSHDILNKSFATMTAQKGHVIAIRDATFGGGIINEAAGRMVANEEGMSVVYVGDSTISDPGSEDGLIAEGILNAGFMGGYYIANNDSAAHDLAVTNESTGLMAGRIKGKVNLVNRGTFLTMRGTDITGNLLNQGVLELSVDADAANTAVVRASTATLAANSAVIVAPDFSLYTDEAKLQGESYKLINADTLTNAGTSVLTTVLLDANTVTSDSNDLEVTLTKLEPDEVLPGSKSVEAIVEAAENSEALFGLLARTSNQTQLKKVIHENWVNNSNASQLMNVMVQKEATSIPLQRLSVGRQGSLRGVAYGDQPQNKGIWMQMLAADASQESRKNKSGETLSGFDATVSGFSFGLEQWLDKDDYELTYGGALTVAEVTADKNNSIDQNGIKNYQLSVYGSYSKNHWYLDGILNIGQSQHNRSRYVEVDNASPLPIKSEFNSHHYGLQILAGFNQPHWNMMLQPIVGFNYSRIVSDNYKETDSGTGFGQAIRGQTYQKIELGAGLDVSKIFQVSSGELEPSARFMMWHDVKGDQIETTSRYLVGSTEFTSEGAKPEKNSYAMALNLTYRKDDNLTFVVGYNRNQKSGYQSNNYYFRLRYDF
ncbi:hypothetical protein ACH42_07950 [Endozoicomonas sp. (ex Bugula neritina AB1)]|nr:hypothetical protein ACH42_07950 [Endozoicomonas sp. (ex Bugula neritina AB1)]